MLGPFLLHRHDEPCRQMGDADRRFGLVDVLAASPARAHGVNLEVTLVDDEIRLLGDWQHGDGRGGSMNAPLGLGRRHALHPMHAAFELEASEDAAAGNFGHDFLESPRRPLAHRQNLDLPPLPLDIFGVHAEEITGKQGRFVPASAGSDLEDRAALVGGLLRQQRDPNRL